MNGYRAPGWLPGGNLQTIWAATRSRRFPGDAPRFTRERWATPDGDFVDVDHLAGSPRGPDLLLADLRLGGGRSGLHAVRRIRQQLGRAVPVVLVTGDTAPARIREAFDAGHLLLHKPVDPQRLRSALAEAWMGTHAAEVGDDDAAAA